MTLYIYYINTEAIFLEGQLYITDSHCTSYKAAMATMNATREEVTTQLKHCLRVLVL